MMNILDKIVIGGNTAITLLGDGFNLVEHEDPKDITKSTTVLVEGDWKE